MAKQSVKPEQGAPTPPAPAPGEIEVVPGVDIPTLPGIKPAAKRAAAELAKLAGLKPSEPKPVNDPPLGEKDEPPLDEDLKQKEAPDTEKDEIEPGDNAEKDTVSRRQKDKTVSPWKLLKEERRLREEAEKRAIEAEKRSIPRSEWEKKLEYIKTLEAKMAELSKELAYANYLQSPEYKEKYEKPYLEQWQRAMSDLQDIEVETETGETRKFTPNDLAELIELPLAKARQLASERYGALADDVMHHRNRIRELLDQQIKAREEAYKTALERMEARKIEAQQVQKQIAEAWKKANEQYLKSPWLKPWLEEVEGDEALNIAVKEGFRKVDEALKSNPSNPKLTPEEREEVIKKHAAIRIRAALFGRLVEEIRRRDRLVQKLKKKIEQYEGSEPERAPTVKKRETGPSGSAWDSLVQDLYKIAKPM